MHRSLVIAALLLLAVVSVQAVFGPADVATVEGKVKAKLAGAIVIPERDETTNQKVKNKLEKEEDAGEDGSKTLPSENSKLQIEAPAGADPKATLDTLINTVKEAIAGTPIKAEDVGVELEFPAEMNDPSAESSSSSSGSSASMLALQDRIRKTDRMVNGVYFTDAKPARGGIQIHMIGSTGHGTLGGFIYKAAAKKKLYAVTNHHVAPTAGTNVEQPTWGTVFGKVKGAAYGATPHHDVSFIEINDGKKATCSIRGLTTAVTGVHDYGKISAKTEASANAVGQSVQKSGMRTGVSVGYIREVNRVVNVNSGGVVHSVKYHYVIRGTGLPLFHTVAGDHDYGRQRDANSNLWSDNNEVNVLKNNFVSFITQRFGHTAVESAAIVNALGTKGMLTLFSLGGDSGSFIMVGPLVLGHMDAGGYVPEFFVDGTATVPPAGCRNNKCHWDPKLGRWWKGLHKETNAMAIQASLDQINALDPGHNYQVCVEGERLRAP